MPINQIPVHFPRGAIRRMMRTPPTALSVPLPSLPPWPYSAQQEIAWIMTSNQYLSSWMAGPPSHSYMYLEVTDNNRVLPYTTLRFTIIANDVGPSPSTPYECNMGLETGMTDVQARDSIVAQIRQYAATMGETLPNMRSLDAVPRSDQGNTLLIRMPLGMVGAASITSSGPITTSATARYAGVDRPLVYGILGKRRHIFQPRPPLGGAYYGQKPIT